MILTNERNISLVLKLCALSYSLAAPISMVELFAVEDPWEAYETYSLISNYSHSEGYFDSSVSLPLSYHPKFLECSLERFLYLS